MKRRDNLMKGQGSILSVSLRGAFVLELGDEAIYKRDFRLLRRIVSRRWLLAMTGIMLLLISVCAISGCGYSTKAVLPEDVRTIHVDIFHNGIDITKEVSAKDKYEVYRPNLEVDLRDTIVERIFLDGHFKIASKESSDAVLKGEILQYRKDPLRYRDEVVTEYRISLVCDVKLVMPEDEGILMEQNNITGDTAYFTTGSLQKSETEALKDVMNDLARRIVNRIVENW